VYFSYEGKRPFRRRFSGLCGEVFDLVEGLKMAWLKHFIIRSPFIACSVEPTAVALVSHE
jgi:hypothetical protein